MTWATLKQSQLSLTKVKASGLYGKLGKHSQHYRYSLMWDMNLNSGYLTKSKKTWPKLVLKNTAYSLAELPPFSTVFSSYFSHTHALELWLEY